MNISPIKTNTISSYRPIAFRSGNTTETVNTTTSADTTQFKMSAANHKSKKTFIGRVSKSLDNILKPSPGVDRVDPKNSQNPWVRAFLF